MKKNLKYLLFLMMLNSCAQNKQQTKTTMTVQEAHQMMEDVYKQVQYQDQRILYNLSVFNGACNYKIWINDMLVYNMYEGARGELSFPINAKILRSGKQTLKIRIYPTWDRENQKWRDYLSKNSGLDVTINEMDWDAGERQWDFTPLVNYQTPRDGTESLQDNPKAFLFEEDKEEIPFFEETITFQASVPYNLKGWSQSVDLTKENKGELLKEVKAYFEDLRQNFIDKDIVAIAKKYHTKEEEVAQSFFQTKDEAKERWRESLLADILRPTTEIDELKDNYLEFYGNGKVVNILQGVLAVDALSSNYIKENGKKKYLTYDIYLHRPKPGAPLEMIR